MRLIRSSFNLNFTKNVKRLSFEFRILLVPNFAILGRVFQGVMIFALSTGKFEKKALNFAISQIV